jgi:hypothetical protein
VLLAVRLSFGSEWEDAMRKTRMLQYVFAAAAGFAVCSSAYAEDWKAIGNFGWLGVGKAYEVEKGHLYWVGEFSGAFLNDKGKGSLMDQSGWKCPGFNEVDVNNKKSKAAGMCIVKDTDGDQAYSRWQCEGDGATCSGTIDYAGGTGKYQGINGHNTFLGHIQVNWSDGTASGYSTINR